MYASAITVPDGVGRPQADRAKSSEKHIPLAFLFRVSDILCAFARFLPAPLHVRQSRRFSDAFLALEVAASASSTIHQL